MLSYFTPNKTNYSKTKGFTDKRTGVKVTLKYFLYTRRSYKLNYRVGSTFEITNIKLVDHKKAGSVYFNAVII